MNFVLHHHIALRDLRSPAAAAGAMLPDLWRIADRRVFTKTADGAGEDATVRDVLAGIEHHVAIDKWFHDAPVFKDGEASTRDALRAVGSARRLSLFAHVTWELCLDGALLRRVGVESEIAALAESIAAVRPDAHRRAAELHHFGRVERTEEERGLFNRRMDRIFDELARGPGSGGEPARNDGDSWIAGYQTGDGIAGRLEGVRARLRFGAFTADERVAVAAAIDRLGKRADRVVGEILARR